MAPLIAASSSGSGASSAARVDRADELVARDMKRYIRSYMFRIPGYMHPIDAFCYAGILAYQRGHSLSGGVAEIGVFFGRSFFLMAKSLKPGEKAFAADLFESGPRVSGESFQLRAFRDAASRLGIRIEPNCLAAGPSEALKACDILDAIGPARFFSIDGGHAIEQVEWDASLASDVVSPHGVLVFDDFCNPEWPEVSLAVFDFLRAQHGAYLPIAVTKAKLYVCHREFHSLYLGALAQSEWLRGFARKEISMLGSRLLWFHHPISERIMFEALVKMRLGSFALAIQARR